MIFDLATTDSATSQYTLCFASRGKKVYAKENFKTLNSEIITRNSSYSAT